MANCLKGIENCPNKQIMVLGFIPFETAMFHPQWWGVPPQSIPLPTRVLRKKPDPPVHVGRGSRNFALIPSHNFPMKWSRLCYFGGYYGQSPDVCLQRFRGGTELDVGAKGKPQGELHCDMLRHGHPMQKEKIGRYDIVRFVHQEAQPEFVPELSWAPGITNGVSAGTG